MITTQEEKTYKVFGKEGKPLATCGEFRAKQMINRAKAILIGPDMIQLLYDKEDEKRMKQEVMERDRYICYITEEKLDPNEATADHIRSRAKGGSDFEENLACCSLVHNRRKGRMDLEDYIKFLIRDKKTDPALRSRLMERFPKWVKKGRKKR